MTKAMARFFSALIALSGLVLAFAAHADRFDTTRYECGQMDPKKDGFRCAMHYFGPMGPTLFVRVHANGGLVEKYDKRTRYLVDKTERTFYQDGGRALIIRFKRQDGATLQQMCFNRRGRSNCNELHVETGEDTLAKYFGPLN